MDGLTVDRLGRFVVSGDVDVARALLELLPPSPTRWKEAVANLVHETPARRLLGISRVLLELAYSVNPEAGLELWNVYSRVLFDRHIAAKLIDPLFHPKLVRSSLTAVAHAALQCGKLDEALALCTEAKRHQYLNRPDEFEAWLTDIRMEALICGCRVAEALELLRRRDGEERTSATRLEELERMLRSLVPDHPDAALLESAKRFSWSDTARELLTSWLVAQSKVDEDFKQSYADLNLDGQDRAALASLFSKMDEAKRAVAAALAGEIPLAERDDVIHRALFEHQQAARAVQSFAPTRKRTLHDNRHMVNRAAMIVGLRAPTAEELARSALETRSAVEWSDAHGDRYGALMALWTEGLVAERQRNGWTAFGAFASAFQRIEALRPELPTPVARSLLSGTFRTLIPRLASHAHAFGQAETAFRALEFRRGLAVVEANPESKDGPDLAGVHYFSASVFEDVAFVALRTADCTLTVERLELAPERLHVLAARVAPDEWHNRFFPWDRSPRQELARLMEPLEAAFAVGRIQDGDHIASALDHPLHQVPIHYLDLRGEPAARRLTFSRVASLQDLRRIAAADPWRPEDAAGVFVPTSDAVDPALHSACFAASVAPLIRHFGDLPVIAGEEAVASGVLDALAAHDLAHIYAHGLFPPARLGEAVDPMREAGLLIATPDGLPSRSDPERAILCGADIVKVASIKVRHVSLSACVSGLGFPGQGQDMLGFEFALRARGVDSVVASHWHVDAAIAARFFATFYEEWLGAGASRGEAWRRATLAHAVDGDLVATCAACAFSLYGDWR